MVIQSPQAVSTTTAARPDVALAQRAVSSPDPQSAPSQVAAPAQPEPQAQPSPEQVREAVSTTNEVVKSTSSSFHKPLHWRRSALTSKSDIIALQRHSKSR